MTDLDAKEVAWVAQLSRRGENEAMTTPDEPGLTEAWAAAEAALPRSYALMLRGSNDWLGRDPAWKADAYHYDGRRKAWHVEADTPAAALLALAAALRSHTDG